MVFDTLLPADGKKLMMAVVENAGYMADEDGVLGKALRFNKAGSLEERLLRCIAAGNRSREHATRLF